MSDLPKPNNRGPEAKLLASWQVSSFDQDRGLLLSCPSQFEKRCIGEEEYLYLAPTGRYYEEDRWGVRIPSSSLKMKRDVVLEVVFWDRGYGLVEARRLVDPSFNIKSLNPVFQLGRREPGGHYWIIDMQKADLALFIDHNIQDLLIHYSAESNENRIQRLQLVGHNFDCAGGLACGCIGCSSHISRLADIVCCRSINRLNYTTGCHDQ